MATTTQAVVVFTGTLQQMTRKEAIQQAQSRGFKVSSSLTKATTLVVYGDNAGKKLDQAKQLGVQMLSEDQWQQQVALAAPVASSSSSMGDAVKKTRSSLKRNAKDQAQVNSPSKKPRQSHATTTALPPPKPATTSGNQDQVVVFTGTLTKFSRKQATSQAQAKGFKVGSSISKSTTILVYGDRAGSKLEQAKKYGIDTMSEDEWLIRIGDYDCAGSQAVDPATKAEDEEDEAMAPVFDDATASINGILPKKFLENAVFHEVSSSSSSSTYKVKRTGSVYTCSCPAWRNQRHNPMQRTCKHLKELLGEAYELARAKASSQAPRGSMSSSGSSKGDSSRAKGTAPKLLLANKFDRNVHDPTGWWMSEKLDGVRAFWDAFKQVFLSRLGNVYPAPDWFTKGFPTQMDLDGELFGGRKQFQSTVGIVKSANTKQWNQLVYRVFDAPSCGQEPFEKRMEKAQQAIKQCNSKFITWLPQQRCKSLAHVDQHLEEIEKLGGEGVMIRQPKSTYFHGRSNTLLKIKSFHDGEARILGYEDGKGKYTGMVGALRCEMATGKQFKVSSGLSDKQRGKPPHIGSIIVYKCQELTDDGLPRFPIFVGIAADKTKPKDPICDNTAATTAPAKSSASEGEAEE